MSNTQKRKVYVTHAENMKYFGGKLATWRNPFCYINRAVKPFTDPNGIWDECATMKTPSGVIVIVEGDEIVGVSKQQCPSQQQFMAAIGPC